MRPTDWFLVGLAVDPVPGDGFGVRVLAAKYAAIAGIADDAARGVHAARTSGPASAWVGDAGEVFRDRSHRMPGELAHAHESYGAVDAALRRWADTLDDAQAQADRGLQLAREAHADRRAAAGALVSAELAWTTAHAQQLTYQVLEKSPLSVPSPTPAQLRSTDRAAHHAELAIASARGQIADADARLGAARALVLEAKERRGDGERAAVHAIAAAADLAVKPSSVWEAIQDSAAWQTIVAVATVVLTIVSIVAIFAGGPLVWALILAATVLLLVNALLSIAQGKDAWGELVMLAIGLIPGGRLLGVAAHGLEAIGRMGVAGEHMADGIAAVAVRGGTAVVTRVIDLAGARIADAASAIAGTAVKAIHAGSADPSILTSIFQREYHDVFDVNAANYFKNVDGFAENCTRCAIATDHTIAGEVSSAMPLLEEGGAPISDIAEHFGQTMSDFTHVPDFGTVAQMMHDLGEGSRGVIYGGRATIVDGFARITSGHVFNVIHDSNGIVFLDGQVGQFAELEPFAVIRLLITAGR